MDKSPHQSLVGHVSCWQNDTIEVLMSNNVHFFDMTWLFQGEHYKDCRHLYASRSTYFRSLFSSQMMKGTVEYEDVVSYRVGDFMGKKHIFDMIRIFCHTGIVRVDKGEPILKTLDRYAAFHYYELSGGMEIVKQMIMDVINPTNAIQALEYALSSPVYDSDLLPEIEKYISIYAFVVFKHKSFFSVKTGNLSGISEICKRDDLNIKEIDLLKCLYKLCDKRVVADKTHDDTSQTPWDMMVKEFPGMGSLWSHLRVSSISVDEFLGFIHENENCLSNDDIVNVLKFLYSNDSNEYDPDTPDEILGSHISKKRKLFQPISFYPRNLQLHGVASPQTDITYWDDSRIKIFFTFDYTNKDTVVLPPTPFQDYVIHCTVYHSEKTINLRGTIHGRSIDTNPGGPVKITSSVVNFKHDRWRKKSITCGLRRGIDFNMNNILSWNSIEKSDISGGYLYNLDKYPEFSPDGTWVMMSLSVEKID